LFSVVPLLSILLDLAGAVAGSEPYPFNKKFKANKTDISRARDWLAQYVPPCDLIGTVASATRGEAELRTIAVASGQRIASDPKKVTLLIKVQAQVRVFLARRLFARLLRDRYFREKTARELLETEQTYRRGLDVLSTFYTKRLKTAKDASGRLLVSAEEHTVLFGGLLGLAEVSQDFVERLERRIGNWRSSSVIGDVFLKVAGSLKLYSVYVKSFADADELLKRKLRASSEFEQYLAQCQRDSGLSLDLVSLLITPVQRLPRYELLLRELLNRTDGAHADAEPLRRALHEVSSVARYVNDRQRDADSQRALLDAQKRILGRPRDFVQPHRALINEGDVLMGAKKDARRLFLMSDLLVVTRRLSRLERLKEENATAVRYVDSLSMDTVRLRPLHATSLELVGVSRFDVSETPDAPAAAAPTKEKTMVMWFATEGEMSTWLHRFDDIQRSAAVAMLPAFPPPLLSDADRKALRKQYEEGEFVITPPIYNEAASKAAKSQFMRHAEPAAQAVIVTRKHRTVSDSDDECDTGTAIFNPSKMTPQLASSVGGDTSDTSSESSGAPTDDNSSPVPPSRPLGESPSFNRRASLRLHRPRGDSREQSPSPHANDHHHGKRPSLEASPARDIERGGSLRHHGTRTGELYAAGSSSPDLRRTNSASRARSSRRRRSHIGAQTGESPQSAATAAAIAGARASPVPHDASADDSDFAPAVRSTSQRSLASGGSSGSRRETDNGNDVAASPATSSATASPAASALSPAAVKRSRRRTSQVAALDPERLSTAVAEADDRVSAKVEVTEYLGGYYDEVTAPTPAEAPVSPTGPRPPVPVALAPVTRGPPPVVPPPVDLSRLQAPSMVRGVTGAAVLNLGVDVDDDDDDDDDENVDVEEERRRPKILAVEVLSDSETPR
jgi:hypothetical protein